MEHGRVSGMYCDLNTGTKASGGALSPRELCFRALGCGIGILGITDRGVIPDPQEIAQLNAQFPMLRIIPGCEFETQVVFESGRQVSVYLVGLFLEPDERLNRLCHCPGKLQDTVEEIRRAEGMAVLADPFRYGLSKYEMDELLRELHLYAGAIGGLEAYHAGYDANEHTWLSWLATKHGLYRSAASGFRDDEDSLDNHFPVQVALDIEERRRKIYNRS